MTVKITDTTMRDGHQPLLATRMRSPLGHPDPPEAEKGLGDSTLHSAPRRDSSLSGVGQRDTRSSWSLRMTRGGNS